MRFFDEIFLEIFKRFRKEMEKGFVVIIYFTVLVKMLFIFVRFILDGIGVVFGGMVLGVLLLGGDVGGFV